MMGVPTIICLIYFDCYIEIIIDHIITITWYEKMLKKYFLAVRTNRSLILIITYENIIVYIWWWHERKLIYEWIWLGC